MLPDLNMDMVYSHYQLRLIAHKELVRYFEAENIDKYAELALGIARPEGNYSASEHNLGPQVLSISTTSSVINLAKRLIALHDVNHVPITIYQANIPYLRISLGSEMAMMLNPDKYWVGNVRTIYSHLIIKHKGNSDLANEELHLYIDPDGSRPSKMEYKVWEHVYLALEDSLKTIAELGYNEAKKQGSRIGEHKYMWADAICSHIYSCHT